VNKAVKSKETIKINGEIIIDTNALSKSDIVKLEPFITNIKVLSEETINVNK
jgi:hypothetical protein